MKHSTEVILFDLGGVLVELGEQPIPTDWLPHDDGFDLSDWFASKTAMRFEKGLLSAQSFAESIRFDLKIEASSEAILEHFTQWPVGPFPGVQSLLEDLGRKYRLAILSNTNELHWPRLLGEFNIAHHFEKMFASHKMKKAKPDLDIFHDVIKDLNVKPENILFLDDNLMNIDASKQVGINGHQVKGIEQTYQLLDSMDITDNSR